MGWDSGIKYVVLRVVKGHVERGYGESDEKKREGNLNRRLCDVVNK